jgi:hypothetical protein
MRARGESFRSGGGVNWNFTGDAVGSRKERGTVVVKAWKGGGGGGWRFRWLVLAIPIVIIVVRLAATGSPSSGTPPPVPARSRAPLTDAATDPLPSCAHDRGCFVTALNGFGAEATSAHRPELAAAAKQAVAGLADAGSCDAAQADIDAIRSAEVDPKADAMLLLKQVDVLVASLQYCDPSPVPALPAAGVSAAPPP